MTLTRYSNDARSERVFAAEIRVRDLNLPQERRFTGFPGVVAYVHEVLEQGWPAWYAASWPVTVDSHNLQTANYRNGAIYLPRQPVLFHLAARELVILHELAHHFTALQYDHGPMFVHAFLDLVHGMLPAAADPLRQEFIREGVMDA